MDDVKKEVEAILFSAGRTVPVKELQSLLDLNNPGLIHEAVKDLMKDYEEQERPLLIVKEEDGWKLTVKEKFLPLVQKINPHTELSKTILETLAVIAWKQPALQSDVIKVRTNKAYDHIAELERLGFISKEKHGRSFTVKVTQKFLDYFDLHDEKAIKDTFKDFKDMEVAVQNKADELGKGHPSEEEKMSGQDKAEGHAKRQTGEKSSEDSGIGLKSYTDVPPDTHNMKIKTGKELELYKSTPEQDTEDELDERDAEAEEAAEESEEHEETEEEKARRIARELVEEEAPEEAGEEEHEESAEERKLHPKLEEFVGESLAHITPKDTEDHTAELEEQEKETEEAAEEHAETKEEPMTHETPETEESGKPKPAEEYPGQFDEEQQAEEDGEAEADEKEGSD